MWRFLQLRSFRRAFLFRGLIVWIGIRFAGAWVGVTDPNLFQVVWILGMVGLVLFIDARRREEDILLANLGIPGAATALGGLPLPVLVELLLL